MKQALIAWFKTNGAKHTEALLIAAACIFLERTYMTEHDARLLADAQVHSAQATIELLKQQQTAIQKQTTVKIVELQREAEAVKTPAQAVAALNTVTPGSSAPLEPAELPDAPERVAVNAVPLFQDFNTCKQNAVNLTACTGELSIQKQIDVQKDEQITALKKKPGFLHRLGHGLKIVGCAAAGGAAGSLAGGKGAAIGAAAGAAACQMF